jgi:hypothetical protein
MITLLTVSGTVSPWWLGYPADAARYLTEWQQPWYQLTGEKPKFRWQGVGYEAATFPMRPSILHGWEELVRLLLEEHPSGLFTLSGYSQGADVVCLVWLHELRKPGGRLHHRLNDCLAVFTYGNPMRCPNIAYGNTILWGKPVPGEEDGHATGGIAGPADLRPDECLFPDGHPDAGEPAVFDFANEGDIYTSCPVGDDPWEHESEVGKTETMVYESVLDFNGGDLWAWTKTIFGTALPWKTWSRVQAIWNGIQFASLGMNAPHWQYSAAPEIRYLEKLGHQFAAK